MKTPIIYLLVGMCLTPVLQSCSDEPLIDQTATGCTKVPATRVDESVRGYFRDITGLDPALQSQLIEMSFPVTVEGVQTNIDAQFSVMPIHIFEDNGADKSGDYYVIEADFTAHNAPLKDYNLFMKSLEVAVTPLSTDNDNLIEEKDIYFYEAPKPSTTLANTESSVSTTIDVKGSGNIGALSKKTIQEDIIWQQLKGNTAFSFSQIPTPNDYQQIFDTDIPINSVKVADATGRLFDVPLNSIYVNIGNGQSYFIASGKNVQREIACKPYLLGHDLLSQHPNPNYTINSDGVLELHTYFEIDNVKYETRGIEYNFEYKAYGIYPNIPDYECFPISRQKISVTPAQGKYGECLYLEGDVVIGQQEKTIPKQLFAMAGTSFGYSWHFNQKYFKKDLTTRLNTNSNCGLNYKYVVENIESVKGLPRVAQADLNGHATWVWHMPLNVSTMSEEEVLADLFKLNVSVKPVYGHLKDISDDLSINVSQSVLNQTASLKAPYRKKLYSIQFTNHGISPMMNVRLLTVPYDEWIQNGKPDNQVILERPDPLMSGESIRLPATDVNCFLICDEINPATLDIENVRQTELINMATDANTSRLIKLSTFDTSPVMVYKN